MHPVLEIQYWVFFLAQAGKRDHIHMNGLNQIYIIYVSLTACKKIFSVPQLIFKVQLTLCFQSLWVWLIIPT